MAVHGIDPGVPETGLKWVENRSTEGRRALDVGELWAFRELVWFLASRDVRVRYKQAALGLLWAILQPLAGAAVLTFVFQRLADVPSGTASYQSFVFSGLAVWTYFSSALGAATASLVSNASLDHEGLLPSPRRTSVVAVAGPHRPRRGARRRCWSF